MPTVMHIFLHANPLLIYGLVALILLLESTAVPIANTTVLLLTGALASSGHLNIWALGTAAILGSIAGASIAYALGANGGRRILLRVAAFFHVKEEKVLMAERWCQRSGLWMIFLSRMTPYVRPFACIPAGIAHIRFSRFFLAALAGSTIWCVCFLTIGLNLGRRWVVALELIQHYTLPTLGILALLITGYIVATRLIKRRLHSQHQLESTEEKIQKPEPNLLKV